jgi:uncharacterized protein with HEPN domain
VVAATGSARPPLSAGAMLDDVALSARLIVRYVERGGPEWDTDDLLVDAIAKRVEQIGEMAKRLDNEVDGAASRSMLVGAKAMRDVLAHSYHRLDRAILRQVVEADIPPLIGLGALYPVERPPRQDA